MLDKKGDTMRKEEQPPRGARERGVFTQEGLNLLLGRSDTGNTGPLLFSTANGLTEHEQAIELDGTSATMYQLCGCE